jgi:hypothetical protein
MLASALICYETYYSLPFKTLNDNRHYFIGFFVISMFGFINFVASTSNININICTKVVALIVISIYAFSLIEVRIKEIMNTDINHIKDARILAFYLT